jgi:hypothetical protein
MTADRYLDLVPSWNADRPKFTGTIELLVTSLVDLQNFAATVPEAFDLDFAVGRQLDVVGEWIGRSRRIVAPADNIWFSFDIPGLGLDEAPILGPYEDDRVLVSLDDDTYRRLLRAKIIANAWDGTVEMAQTALDEYFIDPDVHVWYDDRGDWTGSIVVSGKIPSTVDLVILADDLIPLDLAGMRIESLMTTVDGSPAFGFDADNAFVGGLDVGAIAMPIQTHLERF